MSELKKVLMGLGYDAQQAEDEIREAKAALAEYLAEGDQEAAYDVCSEFWGLEPDYLDDLL